MSGWYECPTCGAAFYGGGAPLHNRDCPEFLPRHQDWSYAGLIWHDESERETQWRPAQ